MDGSSIWPILKYEVSSAIQVLQSSDTFISFWYSCSIQCGLSYAWPALLTKNSERENTLIRQCNFKGNPCTYKWLCCRSPFPPAFKSNQTSCHGWSHTSELGMMRQLVGGRPIVVAKWSEIVWVERQTLTLPPPYTMGCKGLTGSESGCKLVCEHL